MQGRTQEKMTGPKKFPIPFPPFPLPFLSSFLPLPSLFPFPVQLGDLRERCKLTSGVWGGAPAEIDFEKYGIR